MDLKFTVLSENFASKPLIKGELGLSVFIETPKINILFDTGASDLFFKNSRDMHMELYGTGAVVLSHGHYDHTSGLVKIIREAPDAEIYIHPDALNKKFHVSKDGSVRSIGMPEKSRKAVLKAEAANKVHYIHEFGEIVPEFILFSTGGRVIIPEGWHFYCNNHQGIKEYDRFNDELALLIKGENSACLFVGCSHPGILNIYDAAAKLTDLPITYVIGGSHLHESDDDEIKMVADYFAERDVKLYLGHCTGINSYAKLFKYGLGGKLFPLQSGMQLSFEL